MTLEAFRHRVRKKHQCSDWFNYILACAILSIGVYFLYKLMNEGFNQSLGFEKYSITSVPAITIVTGTYMIWRISKNYKIKNVQCYLSIEEKKEIIEAYFKRLNLRYRSASNDYLEYQYKYRYWTMIEAKFYLDKDMIYFNFRDGDPVNGVVDFGVSKRESRSLDKYLKANV